MFISIVMLAFFAFTEINNSVCIECKIWLLYYVNEKIFQAKKKCFTKLILIYVSDYINDS